jgi:hypothetical protein
MIRLGQARGFVSKSGSPEALADPLLPLREGLQVVRSRLGLSERPAPDPAPDPSADPSVWATQCRKAGFDQDARDLQDRLQPRRRSLLHLSRKSA